MEGEAAFTRLGTLEVTALEDGSVIFNGDQAIITADQVRELIAWLSAGL